MSVARATVNYFEGLNKQIKAVGATYANGGFIGGSEGSKQVVMAHGGELVLNRSQQAALGSTFNITVNGNVDDPQDMARTIAEQVNAALGEAAMRNEQTRSR